MGKLATAVPVKIHLDTLLVPSLLGISMELVIAVLQSQRLMRAQIFMILPVSN